MSEKKNRRNRVFCAILIVLVLLMFWPRSRMWFQEGLMDVGLYKPNLEYLDTLPARDMHTGYDVRFVSDQEKTITNDDLRNKVIFINFWATWCPPCRAEMPSVQVLYDRLKENTDIVPDGRNRRRTRQSRGVYAV